MKLAQRIRSRSAFQGKSHDQSVLVFIESCFSVYEVILRSHNVLHQLQLEILKFMAQLQRKTPNRAHCRPVPFLINVFSTLA